MRGINCRTGSMISVCQLLIALSLGACSASGASTSTAHTTDRPAANVSTVNTHVTTEAAPAVTCPSSAPAPVTNGEFVDSLAASTESKVVYAGVGGPKVFRSTDCGQHWVSTGALPQAGIDYVVGVAAEPGAPNVIYTFLGGYRGVGIGIYRSIDSGAHWTALSSGPRNTNVDALGIDPANPNVLFAGTSSGVQSSSDRGNHWTPSGSGPQTIRSFAFLPRSPSHPTGVIVAASSSQGTFRSTDGGHTWNLSNAGLPTGVKPWLTSNTVVADVGRLYLGTGNGIFVSADSGLHWAGFHGGLTSQAVSAIQAAGAAVVVGTGQGVFTTTATNPTWRPATGLARGYVQAMTQPGSNAKYLLETPFNAPNGVYRSTDGGNTWIPSSGGHLSR